MAFRDTFTGILFIAFVISRIFLKISLVFELYIPLSDFTYHPSRPVWRALIPPFGFLSLTYYIYTLCALSFRVQEVLDTVCFLSVRLGDWEGGIPLWLGLILKGERERWAYPLRDILVLILTIPPPCALPHGERWDVVTAACYRQASLGRLAAWHKIR